MRIESRTLSLPKGGNAPEDYEDAAWPLRAVWRESRSFRCAVADGATETSFSGLWARLLVRAYCSKRLQAGSLNRDLVRLRALWQAEVGGKQLPWYAEEKLRSGAFSSLLGFSIDHRGTWKALAIGDSCLVQRRGNTLCASFPLVKSEEFTNRPLLLGSNGGEFSEIAAALRVAHGTWEPGDAFYLMTDALASWFLATAERGGQPWVELDQAAGAVKSTFDRWVIEQRRAGTMRNDDLTLLRLVVE